MWLMASLWAPNLPTERQRESLMSGPGVRLLDSVPHADVAQLVERNLAKVEVAGSIPVIRSRSPRSTPGASLVFTPVMMRLLRMDVTFVAPKQENRRQGLIVT